MKVGTILEQIDLGSYALPEFQRGYVWNRAQVRGSTGSQYREGPVALLIDEPESVYRAAVQGGYSPFTDVNRFRDYAANLAGSQAG